MAIIRRSGAPLRNRPFQTCVCRRDWPRRGGGGRLPRHGANPGAKPPPETTEIRLKKIPCLLWKPPSI